MLKYLAPYIPNESDLTAPLRSSLKKNQAWTWEHEHDTAMEAVKGALSNDPALTFYGVTKIVRIQADASQTYLGAVLLQENKPIAYASRTLSMCTAEEGYAQIGKDMLTITLACWKFHPYIYMERPFTWTVTTSLWKLL